ncbi:MAG: hypothetical protein JWM44_3240 [Bacilli bacterium]|jgi:hypothetical protein|nr:hypothetical protein [Bacilli bacterium]
MAELHIQMKQTTESAEAQFLLFIEHFAEQWACDLQPVADGYLLLPEVMMRKHGIFVFFTEDGCKVCREEDATTWEDFLLMKLAHLLAERCKGVLRIDGEGEPLQVAPDHFATFDHYVETVLENYDDVVKDMKKYWLYTHRNRSFR